MSSATTGMTVLFSQLSDIELLSWIAVQLCGYDVEKIDCRQLRIHMNSCTTIEIIHINGAF